MPGATSMLSGGTQQFQATVTGNANQGVTWKVNGGDAFGTITGGGLYTAPGAIPPGSTATIVATSQADGVTHRISNRHDFKIRCLSVTDASLINAPSAPQRS